MKISNVLLLSGICSFSVMNGYGVKIEDITIETHGPKIQQDLTPYAAVQKKMDLAVTEECVKKVEDYEWGIIYDSELRDYLKNNNISLILNRLSDYSDPDSLYQSGMICRHTNNNQLLEKNISLIQEYANKGQRKIQYLLAKMYRSGKGVPENESKAFIWYTKAANQDYAPAQYGLAISYYYRFFGEGVVTQNYEEAFKLYQKAAEQGYVPAQYSLGKCYENGEGVSKNLREAIKWYKKAADQGCYFSKDYLNDLKKSHPQLFVEEYTESLAELFKDEK